MRRGRGGLRSSRRDAGPEACPGDGASPREDRSLTRGRFAALLGSCRRRPAPRRYAAAVVAFGAGAGLSEALRPMWGESAPFLFYFPAVMFSSWYGGFGPGLLCLALCLGAILQQYGAATLPLRVRAALFALLALFVIALNETLHRAGASLSASLRRTNEILESISDAFYLVDRQWRFLYVNGAAERLWGRKREELLGRVIWETFPQAVGTRSHKAHLDALESGRPITIETISPVLNRWIEADIRPAQEGLAVYFRDISSRKRVQQELERLVAARTKRLQEVNDELDSLTYSASHDLRATIRKIMSYCDLIRRQFEEQIPDVARHYFHRIQAAAENAQHLIVETLNLAAATQRDLSPSFLDLSSLAADALENLRRADSGRKIRAAIAPNMRAVGDPELIGVVLHNLLDNAWKFTADRQDPTIEVGMVASNVAPAFYVKDNGVGFDMAHTPKLFQPFERLHDRLSGGAGVGLAIVQRIIRRHGGEVWADSRPGQGATFYFTLPGRPS